MTFRSIPHDPMASLLTAAVVGILFWPICPLSVGTLVILFFSFILMWLLTSKIISGFPDFFPGSIPMARTILLLGAVAVFFTLWSTYKLDLYPSNHLAHRVTEDTVPLVAEAVVCDLPQLRSPRSSRFLPPMEQEPSTTFVARIQRIRNGLQWQESSGRILVTVSGDRSDLSPGDQVRLKGRFSRILPPSNPYDWNRAFSWRTRRILVRISIQEPTGVELLSSSKEISRSGRFVPYHFFDSCRRSAAKTFDRYLTPDTCGLAKAMLIGLRSDLDEETQEIFRSTGTVHLLAISGMHLSLVAGFFVFFFRGLGFSSRPLAILLLLGMTFYVFLTDMQPPVLRSMVLLTVGCGGAFLRRRSLSMNSLCLAGLFILVLSPGELFQFGTQLSFLATGILILGYQKHIESSEPLTRSDRRRILRTILRSQPGWRGRFCRIQENLAGILKINVAIWVVLAPLILLYTNLFTPVAMIVNPFLWLPMTAALVCGFGLMIAGWLCPFLCPLFALGVEAGFRSLLFLLHGAQNLPGGFCFLPALPDWWCLVFYTGLIVAALFPALRPRRRNAILLLLFWLAIGIASFPVEWAHRYYKNRSSVEVLAVGHGQAVLLTMPDGRTALYDCGSFSQGNRAGELAAQALWHQGKTSLSLLMLSHADSDHYNGCAELLRRVQVRQVVVTPYMFLKRNENLTILQELLRENGNPIAEVQRPDSLRPWGFPEFTVLHPEFDVARQTNADESNAVSLVLDFRHESHDFTRIQTRHVVLTGDLSCPDVPFLNIPGPALTALFIPHHGGNSHNTQDLIDWGRPRSLLISDGTLVRDDAERARLRQEHGPVFSTLEDGWFRLDMDRQGTRVHTWRKP